MPTCFPPPFASLPATKPWVDPLDSFRAHRRTCRANSCDTCRELWAAATVAGATPALYYRAELRAHR